jgi:hypothetical protein
MRVIEQTEKENELKPFHDLHNRIKSEVETVMTLRDYFAAKFMPAILLGGGIGFSPKKIAELSYKQADAMMEARKQEKTNG